MQPIPENILTFINRFNVLSVSGVEGSKSWSANSFYVFDPDEARFIVVSHKESRHMDMILRNPHVSGTISQQTESVIKIQGIQYSGTMKELVKPESKQAFKLFYTRFPYARLIRSPIWAIMVDYFKFTDNTLGFGKKTYWERTPLAENNQT